ncbi:hypothetical protein Hanom_Chr11g01007281 [Helianthus anomalus]
MIHPTKVRPVLFLILQIFPCHMHPPGRLQHPPLKSRIALSFYLHVNINTI